MNTSADNASRATALRAEAARHEREAAESFERCDTDGFVSQWAHGLSGQKARLQAEIEEAGGVAEFPSLHDAISGERVKAKLVQVANPRGFGTVTKWIVLDDNDRALHWVPAFKQGRNSKLHQLGLVELTEQAPAVADFGGGSGRGLSGAANVRVITRRTDGGFPTGARTLTAIRRGR